MGVLILSFTSLPVTEMIVDPVGEGDQGLEVICCT
jgi:hypothetical protein